MRIAVVLIFCIFVGANSFLLQQSRQSIPAAASLSGLKGFPSQVGENFGYDKLNTLLNLINSAAQFYRDDLEKNLHYIQTNMQAAYGVGNVSINVIIQVNSTESITSTFIYRCFYCFASLPTGVSTINPTWSYFAYIIDRHDNWITEYVPHIGQGSGINTGTVNAIKNIIFKRDGNRKCTCR